MKLKGMGINYPVSVVSLLCALTGSQGYAGAMGPAVVPAPGKVYAGIFGGGGSSTRTDISQFATAYFLEAAGGPLAVDSFGRTDDRSMGIIGGQVGYQWGEILLNSFNSVGLVPAVELEGYYLGKSTFTGHDVSNNTVRLDEHDFLVRYPFKAGVFLTNAVLNLNLANYNRWHPYVGAGIGGAVTSISGASAIQVAPPEVGVNHYNASTSDKDSTFAAQVKAGLNFDITSNASIFVEYRWLYLASTDYMFGSTVFPGHAATSSWLVNLDPQHYNMGAVGLRYSIGS